jgi:hypothetical protein
VDGWISLESWDLLVVGFFVPEDDGVISGTQGVFILIAIAVLWNLCLMYWTYNACGPACKEIWSYMS